MGCFPMGADSFSSSLDPLSPLPLAAPVFASTPNIDRVVSSVRNDNLLDLKETRITLLTLDAVALDKIFSFLSDEDLRVFHQVSHVCKAALEIRPLVNKRRLELVQKIRENKENIARKLTEEDNLNNEVSRVNRSGHKPGTLLLVDCRNFLQNTRPETPTTNSQIINVTPTSRFSFQSFEEAEKSLLSGQKLISCVKCRGPVPSPSTPTFQGSAKKTTATRCRLTSRMGEEDFVSPVKSEAAEVKGELELSIILSKKSKPQIPPVSPISLSSTDVPTTQALGERMSAVLVISDKTATTPVSTQLIYCNTRPSDSMSELYSNGNRSADKSTTFSYRLSFNRMSFGNCFSPQSSINDSFSYLSGSPLSAISNTSMKGYSGMYRNIIFSPEPRSILPSSSILSKSTTSTEGLKENNTLNSTSNDLIIEKDCVQNSEENHNDFELIIPTIDTSCTIDVKSSQRESVANLSFLDEGFSSLPEAFQTLASFQSKFLQSKSSSDYFSGTSSVLRDECISSNFPEISSVRTGFIRNSSESPQKSRSRSLGNMTTEDDVNPISKIQFSESSSSCPNLNESFVLECPNPDCSYRFCSNCLTGEHPGKPCRIIDSESFESSRESNYSSSNIYKKDGERKGKGKVKGTKDKLSSSKKSLRRIAKL